MQVLFVCTGNTCRSCMAETIFNQLVDIENTKAISAGVAVVPRSKTSKNTSHIIKGKFSIDISDRYAVQLEDFMIKDSNLILTMTGYIKHLLIKKFPQFKNRIFTLSEYVNSKQDITDPYGRNLEVYKETFNVLQNSIELLLNKIKEDNGI